MQTPLVVPDASVLLKWALPSDDEPDADKALLLRTAILYEAVHAILPALWLYEVGNMVARRFPTHASGSLSALMKFGLEDPLRSRPVGDFWLIYGSLGKIFEMVQFFLLRYFSPVPQRYWSIP